MQRNKYHDLRYREKSVITILSISAHLTDTIRVT